MSISTLRPEHTRAARRRIRGTVRETAVMRSDVIDAELGIQAFFKCEQLQHTGSFKLRGASHAVSRLPPDCAGVATHSSGNHGAALARAARARGLEAHVVMPRNAVRAKVDAVAAEGGRVHFCEPTQEAREAGLAEWVSRGFKAVPPYDDDHIIAGQGSCALELFEQVPELDAVVAPVGGGGLLAGTALAARTLDRPVDVIGVEPNGADDTRRSLAGGERVTDHRPETMADGLRALVGRRNLELIARYSETVLGVDEADIVAAMTLAWSRLKQVVEPSGAVALAGVMTHPDAFDGQRVGIILSGGNLDIPPLLDHLLTGGAR
ncbi:MAG: pyridoxal-phosphate dependent enzyme [Gammaproteobacteria bacterium]|jgi:threonine dehydratase|nr:pyridoxal-phosphate dependent enzyme [Gammaproteobacteria bacterium]